MIEFSVRYDDLSGLANQLGGAVLGPIDLAPLVPELARILDDENRRARLEGIDIHGGYLVEVRDPLDPRRGGNGPPLAPRYEASRVIANFFVREIGAGPGELRVQAGWSGIPFLVAHAAGAGRLPVRDIIGVEPEADRFITDVFDEFVTRRIRDRLDGIDSGDLGRQFDVAMGI
jgi:hypothetical protein